MSQTETKQKLSDATIFLGNLLDHFNTSLYAFMAPILAPIFFPNHEPIVQLILGYSLLSTSLVTRPLGSLIFGFVACRRGAIFSLSISLVGVAFSSILFGCIPEYQSIGYLAPISLIIIRILIGVFASGESTVAKLYVVANKQSTTALSSSCLYESSVMLGIIIAAGVSTWVYHSIHTNAWRIGFIVGGCFGLISSAIRFYFSKDVPKRPVSVINNLSLWKHRSTILKVAVVTGCSHITYNLVFILFKSLVPLVSNINTATMFSLNNWLLWFDLLVMLLLPRIILRYKISYYLVMLGASFMLTISMIPVFSMLESNSILVIVLVNIWVIVLSVMFVCPLNIWCEKLVAHLPEKYLIIGLGNSLGVAFIGKTVPVVCLWLWYKTSNLYLLACYVAVWVFLTFSVLLSDRLPVLNFTAYLNNISKLLLHRS